MLTSSGREPRNPQPNRPTRIPVAILAFTQQCYGAGATPVAFRPPATYFRRTLAVGGGCRQGRMALQEMELKTCL